MIILSNVQSIMSNKDEIMKFIATESYIIYCFTETHTTEEIQDDELYVDEYYLIRCNSNSRFTGGIIMYVYKYITAEIICNVNFENKVWFLGVRFQDLCKRT